MRSGRTHGVRVPDEIDVFDRAKPAQDGFQTVRIQQEGVAAGYQHVVNVRIRGDVFDPAAQAGFVHAHRRAEFAFPGAEPAIAGAAARHQEQAVVGITVHHTGSRSQVFFAERIVHQVAALSELLFIRHALPVDRVAFRPDQGQVIPRDAERKHGSHTADGLLGEVEAFRKFGDVRQGVSQIFLPLFHADVNSGSDSAEGQGHMTGRSKEAHSEHERRNRKRFHF